MPVPVLARGLFPLLSGRAEAPGWVGWAGRSKVLSAALSGFRQCDVQEP